jgi:cell division protein FtsZ
MGNSSDTCRSTLLVVGMLVGEAVWKRSGVSVTIHKASTPNLYSSYQYGADMNRREFIKSVMVLAIAKVSAAKASDCHFSLPITTATTLPSPSCSTLSEDDFYLGTVIKVMGIGDAGCDAIEHAIKQGIFTAANAHARYRSSTRSKMLVTKAGLSAETVLEVGRAVAKAHREDIRDSLKGAHMAFITTGMDGGTGSGAASIVAEVAREMGILTIGVVTRPFSFEGVERMRSADAGIAELEKQVDSLIVISNECIKAADDVFTNAIVDIANIITFQGLVGVDFEDVRTVMGEMGLAKMGSASAAGVDRARIAAEKAVASPLLEGIINLSGAKGVLVNITAAKGNLKMKEVNEVMNTVKTFVADDAHIIFGTVYDEQMADAMRVTVVATGLNKVAEAPSLGRRKYPAVEELANCGVDRYDIPAFLRKQGG